MRDKIRGLSGGVKSNIVAIAKQFKWHSPSRESGAMPAGRPRQFDTERALDAALLLFWRQGYEATSLAQLTRAMRISAPSLYAAFGSKEALFRKVLQRYLERPASYLPKALQAPTARAAVERLFQGAIHMVMDRRHPDGCLLVHGALAAGPVAEPVRRELALSRERAEALVRHRFLRAVEEGDLSSDVAPAQLASFITTVLWGMSVQAAGGATRAQLQAIAKMALRAWPR